MDWKNFSMSDRFARYFFTLVVGNNLFGLFLALSKFNQAGVPFLLRLLLVLAVAYPSSLVCLLAIDLVEVIFARTRNHRLSTSAMIATVALALMPALYLGFRVSSYAAEKLDIAWNPNFIEIARPGILFGAIVTVLALIFVHWLNDMKAHYEQRTALMAAERRLLQARFDLFAKELHPHLLFNVIQNVTSLMTKDVFAAKTMLEELAVYYQEFLLVIDKNAVPLSTELSLCRHFFALQQSRFKQISLTISDQTQGRLNQFLMPPLLLQPFLENAVKFAVGDDDKGDKKIHLTISESGDKIHIAIVNPHRDIMTQPLTGFSKGLKNCENRMKDFFGENARLSLLHEAKSTTVQVDLPYAI